MLESKLPRLKDHSLRELVPAPSDDQLARLRDHFLKDLSAPDAHMEKISHRHVPAGAQLAVAASDGSAGALDAIQQRALTYLHRKIDRPDYLDVEPVAQRHLEAVTARLVLRGRKD